MPVSKSPQFENFSTNDKVYKGVHVKHQGRGMRQGTSTYSFMYSWATPGTGLDGNPGVRWRSAQQPPAGFDHIKKFINEHLEQGFIPDERGVLRREHPGN